MTAMTPPPVGREQTVIGPRRSTLLLLRLGFPLIGAIAGRLVLWVAGWAVSLPWVPFRGPLELLDSLPEPQVTIGGIVVGAVAGLVVAFLAEADMLHVTVADDHVSVGAGDQSPAISRAAVTAVFLDGKALVLLGRTTQELVRSASDLDRDDAGRLERAFLVHGWPWRAGDPYREEFRRWVEGTPAMSPEVNAIFAARDRALRSGDATDAAQLRGELADLGYIVRDTDKRQFWRPTRAPAPSRPDE